MSAAAHVHDVHDVHTGFGRRGEETASFGARPAEEKSFVSPAPQAQTYPFETHERRQLGVSLALRPVCALATGAVSAHRVSETACWSDTGATLTSSERDDLDTLDLERLDCEAFQRGLNLLAGAHEEAGVIPTAYRTVIHSQTRFRYLSVCLQAPITERVRLIAELTGVNHLTPPDRLAEAVALIGVGRRGVLVRASPDPRILRALGHTPVTGLCLDLGSAWSGGREALVATIAEARRTLAVVVLEGLHRSAGAWAQELGATHAVFAAGSASAH